MAKDPKTSQRLCISIQEAAEQLSISARTVRRLVDQGDIPSIKIGRRHMIRSLALDGYLDRVETRAA